MDWSIQEVAKLAGTTSRALRHYDAIGLLAPSRIGHNGYRYYDQHRLATLQRILILKELGLGLDEVGRILRGQRDDLAALDGHLGQLRQERERLERRIRAVQTTITTLKEGGQLMAHDMFDGFDHTQYKEEVEERWGAEAYAAGDRWWRGLTAADKAGFMQEQQDIARAYGEAFAAGTPVDAPEVLAITARHHAWIRVGWQGRPVPKEAFIGLGEMYVADPRFAKNYETHGVGGAAYVRDAMRAWAEREL